MNNFVFDIPKKGRAVRVAAARKNLSGNREWEVIIRNPGDGEPQIILMGDRKSSSVWINRFPLRRSSETSVAVVWRVTTQCFVEVYIEGEQPIFFEIDGEVK